MFFLHTQYSGRHKESYTQRISVFHQVAPDMCEFNLFNLSWMIMSRMWQMPLMESYVHFVS